VASKLKLNVVPISNMVFANPVLPGVAQENKLIGTVFGSKVNTLSKPVEGERGVYMFTVNGFSNPPIPTILTTNKDALYKNLASNAVGNVFKTLQKSAKIIDNRSKFY
jgi:peptidyl-prolyl cis-trans isomerase D